MQYHEELSWEEGCFQKRLGYAKYADALLPDLHRQEQPNPEGKTGDSSENRRSLKFQKEEDSQISTKVRQSEEWMTSDNWQGRLCAVNAANKGKTNQIMLDCKKFGTKHRRRERKYTTRDGDVPLKQRMSCLLDITAGDWRPTTTSTDEPRGGRKPEQPRPKNTGPKKHSHQKKSVFDKPRARNNRLKKHWDEKNLVKKCAA